jgi:hypothetical protein
MMAKKKKSQQAKAPRMTFRERFEQNVPKCIAKGTRRAAETEKHWKIFLRLVCVGFLLVVAIVFFQKFRGWSIRENASTVFCLSILLLIFSLLRRMSSAYKNMRTYIGQQIAKSTVRTRQGHTFRVEILPKQEGGVYLFFTVLLVVSLILFAWSILGIVVSTILFLGEGLPTWAETARFAMSAGFAPFFFAAMVWAFFWLRKEQRDKYLKNYAASKTTVEVSEHPLQIGRDHDIWVGQQGNYSNCRLEFSVVMHKMEHHQVSNKKSTDTRTRNRECARNVIEVLDGIEIRPESPLRHKLTLLLAPEDYVPSVWYKYSPADMDRFDWALRVILTSGDKVLVEREFPLVLVE